MTTKQDEQTMCRELAEATKEGNVLQMADLERRSNQALWNTKKAMNESQTNELTMLLDFFLE